MSPLLAESDTVMSSLTTDCNVGGKLEPLNKPVHIYNKLLHLHIKLGYFSAYSGSGLFRVLHEDKTAS